MCIFLKIMDKFDEQVEEEFTTLDGARYVKIQGVWNVDYWWRRGLENQTNFQVFHDDIYLISLPKSVSLPFLQLVRSEIAGRAGADAM